MFLFKLIGTYGVECFETGAMASVCFFSVFLFLSYIALITALTKFKDDFLGSGPLNEGYANIQVPDSRDRSVPQYPTSTDF